MVSGCKTPDVDFFHLVCLTQWVLMAPSRHSRDLHSSYSCHEFINPFPFWGVITSYLTNMENPTNYLWVTYDFDLGVRFVTKVSLKSLKVVALFPLQTPFEGHPSRDVRGTSKGDVTMPVMLSQKLTKQLPR